MVWKRRITLFLLAGVFACALAGCAAPGQSAAVQDAGNSASGTAESVEESGAAALEGIGDAAFSAGTAGAGSDSTSSESGAVVNAVDDTASSEGSASQDGADSVLPLSPAGAEFPDMDIVVPTTEPAPSIIRLGTRSWIVKDLQARLMELGFMDNDEPTDYYGESTEAAVKIYQRQNKLNQDGVVGTDTLNAILDENAHYYTAQQGDSGTDIVELQQRLYQLGYLADTSDITGNFGDLTLEAVLKFQQMNGLEQDGKIGRKSMALLYSEDVKPNMVAYGEKSDIVLAAQNRLRELGYLTSEPDGNFGLGTAMAIKEFQSRNDLVVDGYLGPGTREVLNSSNAKPFGLVIGDQSDTVTKVQELLIKWGYLPEGSATGYYGGATKQAVMDFQSRNGLSVDGSVGAQTMAKLTSDDVKKPAKKSTTTTGGNGSSAGTGGGAATGGGSSSGSSSSGSSGSAPASTYSGGGSVGRLLEIASSKIGSPYSWGAKGPNAFDCSGFVYWCLNQAGVGQSYLTSGGWASSGRGQRISSINDLQAGDIICVSGHVGICAGNGTVIDASSSNGRVVRRSLSSWWQRNFICGWRIF